MSAEKTSAELVPIEICGKQILACRDGADIWIGVRRVCDVLGLAPNGQLQRLRTKRWATSKTILSVAEDGKAREMACVNYRTFLMWLATIEPGRSAAPELAEVVARFQVEAADAILERFPLPGQRPALPTPSPPELPPLRHGDRYLTVSDMVGQACIDEERLVEVETRLESMREVMVAFGHVQERVTGETSKRVDELAKLVNVIDERCRASSAELVRLRDRLEDTREDVANLRGKVRDIDRRLQSLEKARAT